MAPTKTKPNFWNETPWMEEGMCDNDIQLSFKGWASLQLLFLLHCKDSLDLSLSDESC